ncbi:MAG: system histidine kinase PrsK [Pseudomonadota bacterium]
MGEAGGIWQAVGMAAQVLGGMAALASGAWIAARRNRFGPAGLAIVASLWLAAAWCLAAAAFGGVGVLAGLLEGLQGLGWLVVIYGLFASDGRHASVAPIRPVVLALGLVELCHLGLGFLAWRLTPEGSGYSLFLNLSVMFRLLAAVGGLVLVHNLYLGASPQSRAVLRWPAGGLAALWAFDLNFYTIAYLGREWPEELAAGRGLSVFVLAVLFAIGAMQGRDALRLRPSRAVTFQTVSLIVIGSYFLTMFAIAEWLSFAGGDFARIMEFAVLAAGSVLAVFVLPSRRLRGWLRVTLAKHLFQHRYDYRAEWLRFTRTIGHSGGNSGGDAVPLEERVVQAVADIAESPAGLLLAPDDNGDLVLAARWQWPAADVPAIAMGSAATGFFEREGFIVDLDDLRGGADERGEGAVVPGWLREETRAWALVPLIHYDRLTGVVVLARPPVARKFDWEDFDLLRVVGQQLASYLAEHAGQQALAEASRFDDFHRRIAFVMHDIKNLASQLSLLARNAEKHAEKPAFRDDMLITLRNSADKLNALLARLSRYGAGGVDRIEPVQGAQIVHMLGERFRAQHPVLCAEVQDCTLLAAREPLEQVLVHLIQNAIEASDKGAPVLLGLVSDGLCARFEVVDSGTGMSPEFVRTRLFKPFVSSKPNGFGIGAFEARELVRAMNGRLEVESREGLGSRFVIRLPLAEADSILRAIERSEQKVA